MDSQRFGACDIELVLASSVVLANRSTRKVKSRHEATNRTSNTTEYNGIGSAVCFLQPKKDRITISCRPHISDATSGFLGLKKENLWLSSCVLVASDCSLFLLLFLSKLSKITNIMVTEKDWSLGLSVFLSVCGMYVNIYLCLHAYPHRLTVVIISLHD